MKFKMKEIVIASSNNTNFNTHTSHTKTTVVLRLR